MSQVLEMSSTAGRMETMRALVFAGPSSLRSPRVRLPPSASRATAHGGPRSSACPLCEFSPVSTIHVLCGCPVSATAYRVIYQEDFTWTASGSTDPTGPATWVRMLHLEFGGLSAPELTNYKPQNGVKRLVRAWWDMLAVEEKQKVCRRDSSHSR